MSIQGTQMTKNTMRRGKKLEKRRAEKKKWKTLVMPDPEAGGEIAQEDFDKKLKERGQQKPITPQSPAYQSPLVRRDNEDDD